MIRVFLADDHAILRAGIRRLLEEHSDIQVVGEAENGRDVLQLAREQEWDILILDLALPGLSGMDVLRQLQSSRPRLPVLVLSMHPEDQYAVRVLQAGAKGYLTKAGAPELLVRAVRRVAGGGRYVSENLADKIVHAFNVAPGQGGGKSALSAREFQIFEQLAAGHSQKKIAASLKISAQTVSTYKARIFQKMGFRDNAQLIEYARKLEAESLDPPA